MVRKEFDSINGEFEGEGDNPVKIPFERDFYILKISRNKKGRSKV